MGNVQKKWPFRIDKRVAFVVLWIVRCAVLGKFGR